jgi:8-oxo-dGTP diphosphatase
MAINSTENTHDIVISANMFVRRDGKYLVIRRSTLKKTLPNHVHSIGGKADLDEEPMHAAIRELYEEAGLRVKDIRCEAVVTEVWPKDHTSPYPTNWQIFYFSGEYTDGEITQTEEGELIWLTQEELMREKIFPSVKKILPYILDNYNGTVFARFRYTSDMEIVDENILRCSR